VPPLAMHGVEAWPRYSTSRWCGKAFY